MACQSDAASSDQSEFTTMDFEPKVVKIENDSMYFEDGSRYYVKGINSGGSRLIVLLNHVETDTIGMDPGLSTQGQRRAKFLNTLWSDSPLENCYITHYRRTYLSILPIVESRGTSIYRYEPGDQNLFADLLVQEKAGITLVVGHPQTLPGLVSFLTDGEKLELDYNEHDYFILAELKGDAVASIKNFKY